MIQMTRMTSHASQELLGPFGEKLIWKGSEMVGEWEIYYDDEEVAAFLEDSSSALEVSSFLEAMEKISG